jgi:hypothetical protein
MAKHEVVVGNVGTVLNTDDADKAKRTFDFYINASIVGDGRVAGESVVWFRDGEPLHEYVGQLERGDCKRLQVSL